jgi:hypothetical protein
MSERESLIPKHGGYRNLKSFQVAQLVYDVTVRFCDRLLRNAAAPMTKWFRQPEAECRTSPKAARRQAPPKKLN